MQPARPGRSALFTIALVASACGPLGPLPGGELNGTLSAPPSDWSRSAPEDTIQLETRPQDPYSVNLWIVGLERGAYVAAGRGEDSKWVKHIEADPNVRLRIGDRLYELRAVPVTDEAELESFSQGLEAKYDFEASPEQRDQARIFRLDPR